MAAFLVTGNPGSGKSSLVAELTGRGIAALDGDDLAGWQTASGEPAVGPEVMTDEWLRSHSWTWTRSRIEEAIGAYKSADLFICGIAMNQTDMLDLFRTVFLLSLDHRTQIQRLDEPSNADRNPAARAQILDGRPVFEAQMRAAGAIVLDAREPVPVLASRILNEVASMR